MALPTANLPPPSPDWDEAQCKAALAHLETLQDRLHELRGTIPRILQPLTIKHETPSQLLKSFHQAAVANTSGIARFKSTWLGEETQKILQYANESQKTDSDLSAAARVPRYGWVDAAAESKIKEQGNNKYALEGDAMEGVEATGEVNAAQIVEEFKKAHPSFKVDGSSQDQSIQVRFNSLGYNFDFAITRKPDGKGNYNLEAECRGNNKFFAAVTRCLASRPRPQDLRHLLDMIASYVDAKKMPCVKCAQLLQRAAIVPAARRSKQTPKSDGGSETVWEAFHEECL